MSFYGCVKEGNKVRDCPMIASREREGKQVAPSSPKVDAPTKRYFHAFWNRGSKTDENDEAKSLHFIFLRYEFLLNGGV